MIDKYGEVLIPDLKLQYDIDLRDLFLDDPPWSPRFVLAHIRHLTYDSAFVAELRGGQHFRGWDEGRYLQVAQVNAEKVSNYLFILANTDPKKPKPKPPEPWPLPDCKYKKLDSPGSFAFIAKSRIAAVKKLKARG